MERIFGVVGVVAGVAAFAGTQWVSQDMFAPIMEACISGKGVETLHEYIPQLGGPFICMITQFLLALANDPAGVLVWGLIAGLASPSVFLIYTEAGRRGTGGLARFPALILLLAQLLGISVVFPAIWLPAWIFYRNRKDAAPMALSPSRALLAIALCIILTPLTVLVFTLDPEVNSRPWAVVAGLLGGPAPAVVALLLMLCPAPTKVDPKEAAKAQDMVALGHAAFSGSAFLGWVINLCLASRDISTSPLAVMKALWGASTSGAVAFMTIDLVVLFLGCLGVVLIERGLIETVLVVLASPLIGPGAAFGISMVRRELALRDAGTAPKKAKRI